MIVTFFIYCSFMRAAMVYCAPLISSNSKREINCLIVRMRSNRQRSLSTLLGTTQQLLSLSLALDLIKNSSDKSKNIIFVIRRPNFQSLFTLLLRHPDGEAIYL
jgi:hypothetical protein